MICSYCGQRDATEFDHFIKKRHARKSDAAALERENPRYKAASCHPCNEAVFTRCFVPEDRADVIPELERLTGDYYRTWDGDPAKLREVLPRW